MYHLLIREVLASVYIRRDTIGPHNCNKVLSGVYMWLRNDQIHRLRVKSQKSALPTFVFWARDCTPYICSIAQGGTGIHCSHPQNFHHSPLHQLSILSSFSAQLPLSDLYRLGQSLGVCLQRHTLIRCREALSHKPPPLLQR